MDWFLPSAVSLFLNVGIYLLNQNIPIQQNGESGGVDSRALVFWRGVFPWVVTTPLVLFCVSAPTNPLYYLVVVLASLMTIYSDRVRFEVASKFTAGPPSRLGVVSVWIVFVLWFFVDHSYASQIFATPERLGGVCLAMTLAVFSLMWLQNNCTLSKNLILAMWPAILISSVSTILQKIAMNNAELLSGIVWMIWLPGLIIAFGGFLSDKSQGMDISAYTQNGALKYGAYIGILMVLMVAFRFAALESAENPGYVVLIASLMPFVIGIWNAWKGRDLGNRWAGFLLVFSVILLTVSVKFL